MTAKLGGVWDSLLGDGMRWWITANSDSHKWFDDRQDVDGSAFNTQGYVTPTGPTNFFTQQVYGDFRPGQYSRTYVLAAAQTYAAVMAALRGGRVFVVQGDLIDRLKFTATSGSANAGMGDTLAAARGANVSVEIKVRVPSAPNNNGDRPDINHVDLIAGNITGDLLSGRPSRGPDNQSNPTTRVARAFDRLSPSSQDDNGAVYTLTYTFENVRDDFYIHLRGTNTNDRGATPSMDADQRGQTGPAASPWDDLWFYANPIFVRVQQ